MPIHAAAIRSLFSCNLLLAMLPAQVQPPSPAKLELLTQQRDAKRQQPVFRDHGWGFDYDAALATAAQRKSPILVYFTASNAPQPACDAVEAGLLASREFQALLADFVPLVHITSGIPAEPHANLLQKKSVAAVPSLSFLASDGEVITIQRKLDLATIQSAANMALAYHKARMAVADTDGPQQRKQLFLAELDLGRIQPKDLDARLGQLSLLPAERASLDPRLLDLELKGIQMATHERNRAEQCALVFRCHQQGRRPTEAGAMIYWGMLLHHAAKTKNVALAKQAQAELLQRPDLGKSAERIQQSRELWQQLVDEASAR